MLRGVRMLSSPHTLHVNVVSAIILSWTTFIQLSACQYDQPGYVHEARSMINSLRARGTQCRHIEMARLETLELRDRRHCLVVDSAAQDLDLYRRADRTGGICLRDLPDPLHADHRW